ncbi:MAG TPA: diaminopimelate epimerase [Propionibacteriaceae bacterium]|nr:diaminopimelate epimerase [Propionibacteriaceae bacterium]
MRTWSFAKGHGTRNDFVILVDRGNLLGMDADDVRFLCDRRAGIGADGVLRATMASYLDGWAGDPDLWFMDYRNADGSIAEMCGNGLRVFARYLTDEGLVSSDPFDVVTRAGLRHCVVHSDHTVSVSMGPVLIDRTPVRVRLGDREWDAVEGDVGNPHAVVTLADAGELASLDLTHAPTWEPVDRYPGGANVEFIHEVAPHHVAMRVHERGSGETMSCGTGTVAAAGAWATARGVLAGEYRVDVPGGTVIVTIDPSGRAILTGPAVIVAHGEVTLPERV